MLWVLVPRSNEFCGGGIILGSIAFVGGKGLVAGGLDVWLEEGEPRAPFGGGVYGSNSTRLSLGPRKALLPYKKILNKKQLQKEIFKKKNK